MNIFKKALIVALSVGLISVPSVTREVEAAKTTAETKLYLTPNNNWKADNARFALYSWDGGDKWFDMAAVKGETSMYEVTIPAGIENIIFCRMSPSAKANNWNNKWNQTSNLKYDGINNHYTVKEGTWDKGGGSWSLYAPEAEVFTVEFVTNCDQTVANQEIADGGLVQEPVLEPTGYEFLGWYTDEACTVAYNFSAKVKSNLKLYAKWGEFNPVIAEYNNVIYFENTKKWSEVYCYTWTSDPAVAWPGVKMDLLEGNIFWTNIAKDQANVIFNNGAGTQTKDLKIGNNNYFSYETGSERSIESTVYFQRQESLTENCSDIRFVGTFNDELDKYEEVGFVVGSEVSGQYKTVRKFTTNVYESVIANGSEVNATELEAAYVFVITISGVPGGQKFDVTPYAKTIEGTYVYGTAKTFAVEKA